MTKSITTQNTPGHLEANEASGTSPPDAVTIEKFLEGYDLADPGDIYAGYLADQIPERRLPIALEFGLHLAKLPEAERKKAKMAANHVLLANLPDDEIPDGRFKFEDITGVMSGEIEPPERLIENVLYENRVHWLAGHPGHGKTTLAMWAALQAMEAGRHVVWIDWEAGRHPTAQRLKAVGVGPDLAAERFHLVESPRIEASEAGFEPIALALETWTDALIVFDSASKALSLAGLDENSPGEATQWTASIIMPARDHGATVVVIDHVTKGATRSTAYARGAGSKAADTDVLWYVDRKSEFNRERVGRIELTRQKDREGALPGTVAFEVGDGRGGLPLKLTEALEPGQGSAHHEAETRGRVAAALQEHSNADRKLTSNQVTGLVVGKRTDILDALKALANDPAEPYTSEPGPNRGVLHYLNPDAATALSPT